MKEGGANQPAPIVHNGVIYLNNRGNILQALDAKTGELIWENRYGTNAQRRRHARHLDLRRQDFRGDERRPPDGVRRAQPARRSGTPRSAIGPKATTAPAAVRLSRRARSSRDSAAVRRIAKRSASSARTTRRPAKKLWRFDTVASQGEPGGDTWGTLPTLFRAGGETWITGSYDPELNLTFWGTAQAKPWMRVSRGIDQG